MGSEENRYAPIVLFLYNRPMHTLETLNALKKNTLAKETDLFIFIDGPKDHTQISNVKEVYKIASEIKGFKSLQISNSEFNNGLAKSIIKGVTQILNKYERVIVLEDDLITSTYFLEYMNEALKIYREDNRIWSISGYTPQIINENHPYEKDIYLSQRGCSWGWATWKNRWDTIDWDVKHYINNRKNKSIMHGFNKGGNDLVPMMEDQINGRIDSWAIRWVYNQFHNSKYTVYPIKSLVRNIGFDFSGTHSSNSRKYVSNLVDKQLNLSKDIELDEQLSRNFKKFYDLNFKGYLGVLTRKIGMYNSIRKIQKSLNSDIE